MFNFCKLLSVGENFITVKNLNSTETTFDMVADDGQDNRLRVGSNAIDTDAR